MQSGAEVTPTDQQFMLTAASVGTAEIDLGPLAATRGSSPEVRLFGEHMVAEHTRINAELTQLADRETCPAPEGDGTPRITRFTLGTVAFVRSAIRSRIHDLATAHSSDG